MKKQIVIIGAGLTGTTIANKLSEVFDVTLLEKGPAHGFNLPAHSFKDKLFGVGTTYCHGIGGTTNLWHNGLIQLKPEDIGDSEFLSVLSDSRKYVNEAANLLNFKGDFLRERSLKLEEYNITATELFKNANVDTILVPKGERILKPKSNVSVYHETQIEAFNFDDENKYVRSITFKVGVELLTIKCDLVVVSAGGIGTPYFVDMLLANSYQSHDELTYDFIDHPMGFVGKVKVKKELSNALHTLVDKQNKNYTSRCGIVVESDNLKHICYLRPAASMSNRLDLYKFKSKLATSNFWGRVKCMFNWRFYHPDILMEIYAQLTGSAVKTNVYSLWFVFEQKKNGERSIKHNHKKLEPEIKWNISTHESNSYYKAIEAVRVIFEPISTSLELVESGIDDYLWSAAHHSGALSYGTGVGCLDNNLKLNGVENVYVCDASVVEQHSYTNTGLTLAQLALRLCEHIKCKFSSENEE